MKKILFSMGVMLAATFTLTNCTEELQNPNEGKTPYTTKNKVRNIMIVWALTGIWHGAALNFVVWGMYYGILLILEKFFLNKYIEKWPNILKHLYNIMKLTDDINLKEAVNF